MKYRLKEETTELTKALTIAGIIIVIVCFLLSRFNEIMVWIGKFINVSMPFIFGMAIAFLLTPIVVYVESKLLTKSKIKDSMKRIIGVVCAVLFLILLIGGILALLIPQLYVSVMTLSGAMGQYIDEAQKFISNLSINSTFYEKILEYLFAYGEQIVNVTIEGMQQYLPQILNYSWGFVIRILNFFVGVFIAVYILLSKERFGLQFKKLLFAVFPLNFANRTIKLSRLTTHMLNSFVVGKFIDSVIIGIICFVGMLIFKMPYAVLISFIVGVTNMIPVFGPFIGAIPGIFILLMANPISAVWFALWILALQQFDGNILGPYILGDSLGLPSLWIMFSIIVGGGFFGVVGMFLGVPLFSVIYIVIKEFVENRLKKKELEVEKL
ncbi:AI-2E family transporter [Anaerorhabdus furcosa]|uniref:Predicted PurR-regulated permease PerM n=1 Tax=Anaerorhabdus furcosa TaxID=118967 RepID=A0A1T4PTD6_9FIRM|nr:AI-2E family transporter [Anaerorhabdus furcosa]SJZ94924.1 Predicted PurR-regulated permease PerM [Anaerorhabdus furcosa]